MDIKLKILLICILFLSGCTSWTEIKRDSSGAIFRVEYSGNQACKIDVKNDLVEVDNKTDFKLVDEINMMKAGV